MAPLVKLILMADSPSDAWRGGRRFAKREGQIRHNAGTLGAGIDNGLIGAGQKCSIVSR